MAMNSATAIASFSAQRRMQITTNVVIAVVGALLLTVLLNVLASMRYVRRDVSVYGGYGLSDRTKQILASARGPIQISILYSPDESSKDPTRYIDRLLDYCDELQRASHDLTVENVQTHAARAKLVARLTSSLGAEADKHKAAIANFNNVSAEIARALTQQIDAGTQLQAGEAWLNDFPVYAEILTLLREDSEKLNGTVQRVQELTDATGVPNYASAIETIKTDLGAIKTTFSEVAGRMGELSRLADAAAQADAPLLQPLRDIGQTLAPLVKDLRSAVGEPGAPMPGDLKDALKAFADRGVKADSEIQAAVRAVETLARQHRVVTDHVLWSIQTSIGGGLAIRLPMTRLLSETGKQFADLRLQILGVIDKNDPALMQSAVKKLREFVRQMDESMKTAGDSLAELATRLTRIDPGSKAILDASRDKSFLKTGTDAIEKLVTELNALPELKLGTIGEDIKEDNVVVVEASNKARVLKFDEIWPVRQLISDPGAAGEEPQRAFNGDTAISSALLALTKDKPFATVVLTHFEQKQNPQMQRFMRPPPPILPVEELSALRRRLEGANFKVVEWDLTSDQPPPKAEEGTEPIYVVLPPSPPSPPSPFGGPPPGKPFGDAERKRIRDVLAADGRAIFLATWDVRPMGPFGGGFAAPPYELRDMLRDEWGITVEPEYRITWVIPDNRQPNRIGVSGDRFQSMPVNYFTDHPIGKPFQTSSVRLVDVCPMKISDAPPAGVTVQKVLEVPPTEEYISADVGEIISIINAVNNPAMSGFVERVGSGRPPYVVMAAASKEKAGKIVVCSFAKSLIDAVIDRSLLRQMPDGRLVPEPPPLSNADLLMNALYWLNGQDQWIGAGPPSAPSIRPIASDHLTLLRVVTYGIWPALVFAPGLFIWLARRR